MITYYIIRAKTTENSLKICGEVISNSLLISMVLKGLPSEFKPFTTVITQKEKSVTYRNHLISFCLTKNI